MARRTNGRGCPACRALSMRCRGDGGVRGAAGRSSWTGRLAVTNRVADRVRTNLADGSGAVGYEPGGQAQAEARRGIGSRGHEPAVGFSPAAATRTRLPMASGMRPLVGGFDRRTERAAWTPHLVSLPPTSPITTVEGHRSHCADFLLSGRSALEQGRSGELRTDDMPHEFFCGAWASELSGPISRRTR